MNRRGFLGAMLAAMTAPAFVRAEVLMPIAPVGWTASEGGILVQETTQWGLILPRFISVLPGSRLVMAVADTNHDNLVLHPELSRKVFLDEMTGAEAYSAFKRELEDNAKRGLRESPSDKRMRMAMQEAPTVRDPWR